MDTNVIRYEQVTYKKHQITESSQIPASLFELRRRVGIWDLL